MKKINTDPKVYEARFEMLMKLIRIDKMLRSAKIIKNNKAKGLNSLKLSVLVQI